VGRVGKRIEAVLAEGNCQAFYVQKALPLKL
jgi:hypothetical protein